MLTEIWGVDVDYTIKRELVQIYGEIERQFGVLSKPVRSAQNKVAAFSGDFEKIISAKCAKLTDTQKFKVAEVMQIHRIC
jgi:hypothetical protein